MTISRRAGQYTLATPHSPRNLSRLFISSDWPSRQITNARAPQPWIGHTDDRGILHAQVFVEDVFDVFDRDVFAAADDDVLDAPGDADKPLGIQRGKIAGVEPLAVEVLARQRVLLDVTHKHERPAALQTAFCARSIGIFNTIFYQSAIYPTAGEAGEPSIA